MGMIMDEHLTYIYLTIICKMKNGHHNIIQILNSGFGQKIIQTCKPRVQLESPKLCSGWSSLTSVTVGSLPVQQWQLMAVDEEMKEIEWIRWEVWFLVILEARFHPISHESSSDYLWMNAVDGCIYSNLFKFFVEARLDKWLDVQCTVYRGWFRHPHHGGVWWPPAA